MIAMNDCTDGVADEYQAWIQRVQDTHDAIRYTYGARAGDWAFADKVAVHVVLELLSRPGVFKYQGLPFSARIGSLAEPLLNGEPRDCALAQSVTWNEIQHYLNSCPALLQEVVVGAFVHGYSIEEMAKRMEHTRSETARLRESAGAYLRRAGSDASATSVPDEGAGCG